MLKYVNYDIVFSEIPNETTLAINISNCPCHCKGCHSPYLAEDIGKQLNIDTIVDLVMSNKGVTCIAFMGGDSNPASINQLAEYLRNEKLWNDVMSIKIAWYSGRFELSTNIYLENFDYVKLGPYIEELGGLKSPTTNQRLYKVIVEEDIPRLEDITNLFYNDKSKSEQ